ncbi:antibiotic biosynthesis monooxygenase [uncultured Mucilaginibacter sp.]|uniref:putative quinol monooxygenase n=1 Tax=uncultured Mucilaginibacter sp. TaxID=797541 RepID=UPI0025D617FC|nr:antibiotic biosynthesis monooxygenase [uncultured Mucilaginibacter sp.]
METIQKSLLLRLVAKPGKATELQQLLINGLQWVNEEPKTINWYAFKISENTFGIFDTFPDEDGLHQHHTGKLAQAITKAAPHLLAESPVIEATEILAWK